MHSSRMLTGRSLTVCCSLLPGGGFSLLGGVCLVPGGFSLVRGGVCLVPGGLPAGGVYLPGPGGGSPWSGGVSAWSWGGSPQGVCLVPGGWCLPGLGGVLWRPPSVYRITDTCKNITLAPTSLRPVKRFH